MASHPREVLDTRHADGGRQAASACGGETQPVAANAGRLPALTLAALGIVYGDIGTSPLYAMREALGAGGVLPLTEASGLGVLSLITWALLTIVTLKYVIVILGADNRGEGGIL